MAWPTEPASVRVAETPLKAFSGAAPQGFNYENVYRELWIVALIHRALTDRSCVHRFPDLPADDLEQTVYWEGAYYLLTLALGWTNPAKGLKWWFDAGKPVEDPIMRLLKEVWDHRGQLERFAVWLWHFDSDPPYRRLRKLPGASADFPWSDEQPEVDRRFVESFQKRWSAGGPASLLPYGSGGSNLLHLGHIFYMSEQGELTGELAFSGGHSRLATIVIDSPSNWYYQLYILGERLPSLGDHSWQVDVIVKQWGWMGTYRRSRETGLWFLGKHSAHLRGN